VALSETDVAWLAGLLEGEGYFGMIRSRVGGKVYRYPRVGVTMTDRDVIDRVAAMFDTKVYAVKPGPQSNLESYRFTLVGTRAAELMVALRPWMGGRRQAKIDATLAEYGAIETTQVRRSRSCSEAAAKRQRSNGRFIRAETS
jgi:hypothetical protein